VDVLHAGRPEDNLYEHGTNNYIHSMPYCRNSLRNPAGNLAFHSFQSPFPQIILPNLRLRPPRHPQPLPRMRHNSIQKPIARNLNRAAQK
jgi:hypothetical protein